MKRLFLIRGLPGSGKSTLAEIIAWGCNALYSTEEGGHECRSISTDDSFIYLSDSWKKMVDLIRHSKDEVANDLMDVYNTVGYQDKVKEGRYFFTPQFIKYAHQVAQNRVQDAMLDDDEYKTIIVHNTFSQPWEADVYHNLASRHQYEVFVAETQNSFGNIHSVPAQVIDNMKARWLPL